MKYIYIYMCVCVYVFMNNVEYVDMVNGPLEQIFKC